MKDNFDRNFAIATAIVVGIFFLASMFALGYHFNEFAKAQKEYEALNVGRGI